jgi:catechol 2,3-dioxygenase-like lactoylglutathione lyase family enzyme
MNSTGKVLSGIHHVTAITADAQANINFYCGVLGLRLVKRTVNFDDPTSYHLYYGDESGRPGTIMTFFAWPGAFRGRPGPPQVTVTSFSVPRGSIAYWSNRLKGRGIVAQPGGERFGEPILAFLDPDGLQLEIIEVSAPLGHAWPAGPVPLEHAIRGFHSITIAEEGHQATAALLMGVMGFEALDNEQNRFRYRAGTIDGGPATLVDLLCTPGSKHGAPGPGVVHHVAFRTPDDIQQKAWRQAMVEARLNVSPVMDRIYFHSIYYLEPGGVLFEIATNNPGFTADETVETLGLTLMLPPWIEQHRTEIQPALPPIQWPLNVVGTSRIGTATDRIP